MSAPTVTREQAFAEARAVLDRARVRIAADYTAGRLAPDVAAHVAELDRARRTRTEHRAAA